MRRLARLTLGLAASTMLTGCIAAAVPVIASAAIARKQLHNGDEHRPDAQTAPVPSATPAPAPGGAVRTADGETFQVVQGGMPGPGGAAPVTATQQTTTAQAASQPVPGKVPAGMQYLYGSGEGAAMSLQAYQILWSYLAARAEDRKAGLEIRSVVLSKEATLEVPKFVPCGKKPLAVVLDVDETALLNLGYEADDAQRSGPYDPDRWARWEETGADKVTAVPGAVETLESARRVGITVVFNTNRSSANAAQTVAALEGAGLGHVELGKTLWLRADGAPSGKDSRRWEIAAKYCVVALVGDQLGDFTDLFNPGGVPVPIRRNMASQTMVAAMWGLGWFMLPNPVYGTGLHGSLDEVFPQDKRWTDPGPAPVPAPAPAPEATPAPVPTETPKPQ